MQATTRGFKENKNILETEWKALDRSSWRTRFGNGYRPVVKQTTE
jgi:hypothetical protein